MLSRNSLEYKIAIFKVIYDTLRLCQDNMLLFKTNFLVDKTCHTPAELLKEIEAHCKDNPFSRTAKAWELTEKHYQTCSPANIELLNEMYQYVCKNKTHFGTTFFSSFKNPDRLTEEKLNNPNYRPDNIICNIRFCLQSNLIELENSYFYKNIVLEF